jgi:hypothetical protein
MLWLNVDAKIAFMLFETGTNIFIFDNASEIIQKMKKLDFTGMIDDIKVYFETGYEISKSGNIL